MIKHLKSQNIQILIIILLTVLAYSNIFQNGLVADDVVFVVNWEAKKSLGNIGSFFEGSVPSGHEGVYRPLRSILYAVYYQIFGTDLFGYHLHSLLVHLSATVLIYFITKHLTSEVKKMPASSEKLALRSERGEQLHLRGVTYRGREYLPFITALLFGVHPIHTETITYTASAMESMGIPFFLLSFYLYIKNQKYILWSILTAMIAFFTSEITLTLPLMLVLYDFCFNRQDILKKKAIFKKFKIYLPFFAIAVCYLLIRFLLLGIVNRGPYLADSVYLTFLTMTKVLVKYIGLSILPLVQAHNQLISKGIEAFVYPEYRTAAIQAQSIFNLDVLVSVTLIVGLVIAAIKFRGKIPLVTFGIFWFFISLLPVLEIVPQGAIMNEKFLYIPSFGVILIILHLGGVIFSSPPKWKKWVSCSLLICFLLLVSYYFFLTYQRNKDWHDEITFWSHDAKVYPDDNAYAYLALGAAYQAKRQFEKAETAYKQAIKINPKYITAYTNLGETYEESGRVDLAVGEYQKAFSSGFQNDRIWLKFPFQKKLLISFPSSWGIRENEEGVNFHNKNSKLNLKIKVDELVQPTSYKDSFDVYIKKQKDEFGKPSIEGLAKLPNFDLAYVKKWQATSTFDKGEIWQFLLFKDRKVANIVFYPVNLQTRIFMDDILSRLRFLKL